jgi:hexosaminidase
MSAWCVKRTGHWRTFIPALTGEPATNGGFYTQDDMKEIIKHAQNRFITILPELMCLHTVLPSLLLIQT